MRRAAMTLEGLAILAGLLLCAAAALPDDGLRFPATRKVFVNCEAGSDTDGDGSRVAPFLSPMRARDFVRAVHPFSAAPIEVVVFGDCFPRNADGEMDFSQPVLELVAGVDSGSEIAPISYTGGNQARFLSGMPIKHTAWTRSALNLNIWSVNLIDLGVAPSLFGGFLPPENPGGRTMGKCTTHQLELFFGGKPMTLARYPNLGPQGRFEWMHISSVEDRQRSFQVANDRVLRWADESDAWVHGYWSFDWADSFLKVTNVEKNASTGGAEISVEVAPSMVLSAAVLRSS
jgi:hypothetical protein